MIPVAAGVRIWIASGHTDMRKGMNGLALLVQGKRQADAVQALKFHGMSWSICEIGQP
jgi:transposase